MEKQKLSIPLILALVAFPQISETIYTPALPSVTHGLKTSAHMVETTLSIYFLGFALGVLLWGAISDIYGRRPIMLLGLGIYGVATLGCANVASIEALLAWRFLQALGASVGSVITQTMIRDAYEGTERAKFFSLISGVLAFSPAIGPLLGGFISQFMGWRANFWLLTFLSLIFSIYSYLFLQETRQMPIERLSFDKISSLWIEMIKNRTLRGHILLIGGTNSILFGFYQEAPFVFIEQLGIPAHYYGFFGLLIAAATVLAARISYRKSPQFSAESLIKAGVLCVVSGGVLFFLIVIMEMTSFNFLGFSLAILILFIIFFGVGLIIPSSLSVALKPYQRSVGTAGSIFGGCYYAWIAGCTWGMSLLHNETLLPLPLYILIGGGILLRGHHLIDSSPYKVNKGTL